MRRIFSILGAALVVFGLSIQPAQAAPVAPAASQGVVTAASSVAVFNPDREVVGGKPSVTQVYLAASASGDGCTASPDSWGKANFRPACDKHDGCYSKGSTVNRSTCDARFHTDLKAVCDATYTSSSPFRYTCKGIAATYYAAVRSFGGLFYQGSGKND